MNPKLFTGEKFMGKHLNIGDQVAQTAGISYRIRIDNYVKIVRGVKFYAGYMDDSYAMNDMAAPSVSLEGKSLWLAQSLPVTAWQVLRAKLRMHLLLTAVPGAVLGVCLVAVCDFPAVQMAAVLALAAVFLVFSALLNLFLGLKMPNLHWTSEITPIKQSGAVAISLLGGWAYAAAMAVLYFLVGRHMGFAAYMAAFLALTLAAAVLLYIWVRKKGCAIFASL